MIPFGLSWTCLLNWTFFIPVKLHYNSHQLDMTYVKDIVRLSGVPLYTISESGKHFTSVFLGKLYEQLGTQLIFTSFSPSYRWSVGEYNSDPRRHVERL